MAFIMENLPKRRVTYTTIPRDMRRLLRSIVATFKINVTEINIK